MTQPLSLLAAASAIALAAPASAQLATTPGVTVPSTSVPSVSTPSATVPGVSVPPSTTAPVEETVERTTESLPDPAEGVTDTEVDASTTTDATVSTPVGDATVSADANVAATAAAPVAPAEGTVSAAVAGNAELSTLASALTSAELIGTLNSGGPYTVFAPTNQAFGLIPEATRTQLMSPAQKPALTTLLQHHVVAGNVTEADLRTRIEAGGGTATLQTVAGQTLRASIENGNVVLMGENNSKAYVTQADVAGGNGTIHVVNGILVPRLG
jgi:uncharacterized surface protein with fasciclin (FAS1) repeats